MFAMLHVDVFRLNLSGTDFRVFGAIAAHADKNGAAWPSIARISEVSGLSERGVLRALSRLENEGLVSRAKNGIRNVYTIAYNHNHAPAPIPAIAENHTAQNLDMVNHAHAPVIAKSATTESVPAQPIPAAPVRTVSEDAPKTETVAQPVTADNSSPVEQSCNSGMLPETPASVPPEVKAKTTQLPAIVMAENAKPHNVSDAFMQELNDRPIVQPKPVDDDLMARAKRLAALQAENSARSRAEKLAARGLLNADKPEQDAVKTEEQAVKTEELAAPVESIAQPAPAISDAAEQIILPVAVHESHDSAPQPTLPITCAPQTVAPQQGELLPAPVTAGQGELLPATAKQKRACRLPDDWRLPRSWGEWAMQEMGMTADAVRWEADKFADYWHAKAGANACKVNWQATWRNWIRKNAESGGFANSAAPQQKSKVTQAVEILEQGKGKCRMDNQYEWNPFYVPTPEEKEILRQRGEKPANEQNLINFDSAKKYGTF